MRRRTFRLASPPPAECAYTLVTSAAGEAMRIFRHRLNSITANLIQRLTANHRAHDPQKKWRPTYRCSPAQSVKQRAFVRRFTKRRVALKRVRGGRNDAASRHRQLFSFRNQPIVIAETSASAHVVAIEDRAKLAFRVFWRIVDVAGFGDVHAWRGQCNARQHVGQTDEMIRARRHQDPDIQLVLRPVNAKRSVNGILTTLRSSL